VRRRGHLCGHDSCILHTEGGVAIDLLIRGARVREEVAGWVDAYHHRTVDAIRVAPGVDDRRTRHGTLTQQIDPVVAERRARGLHIVDLRGDAVAAKIKALGGEPIRADPALN
jgi:hypothetical protein